MIIPPHITQLERDNLTDKDAEYWANMDVFDERAFGDEGYTERIRELLADASVKLDVLRRESYRMAYKIVSGIEAVHSADEQLEIEAAKAGLEFDSDLMKELMAVPEIQIKSPRDIDVAAFLLGEGYPGTFLVPNYAVAGCLAFIAEFPKFQSFQLLDPINAVAADPAAAAAHGLN